MKFGKEFISQMVPEWQEAYMDYAYLKTLLTDVQDSKKRSNKPQANSSASLKRERSLYRAFSGLIQKQNPSFSSPHDIENQTIVVNSVKRDGSVSYETSFLMAAEEGGEQELVYFKILDNEFNKVDKFYRSKVEEAMKEAAVLNKQMDALIAFRIKVEKPNVSQSEDVSAEMSVLASEVATSTASLAASVPSMARKSRRVADHIVVITEDSESTSHGQSDDDKEDKDITSPDQKVQSEQQPEENNFVRPDPLEILDRVKMNNTLETPRSTIKSVLKVPKQEELRFTKENLKKCEEQLKRAFIEFYHKLQLLKSYSFLNTLAFSKIMKKYDKISSRNAAKPYMEMVDNSYLGSSDEVTKLMVRVESTFIEHFANANRSKGMSILRPKAKRERHRTTFSTGFFAGCTVSLIVALVLIIHARNIMASPGQTLYMESMFPLYSLFGFIVLHIIMYAANIYFWRRYRVNYSFIFGFKQGTELGYRQVLLLSFGLGALALSSVLLNLDMEMDPKTQDYKTITELLPFFLVILLVAILICPFNILYRSSRFFFLTCLFHCIAAPLYTVNLPDFFLADQLTSQVQAFRSLEFYICYYGWGDFRSRQNTCRTKDVFKTFYFIVAVIPYLSRLLQCLRRLLEEKDPRQGYNGLRYLLTIIAVCLRTSYSLNKGMNWEITAWVFSAITAIFSTYWDIVMDWGLLQRGCRNHGLREKLLVPHKSVYYGAMVLNVLLRFAWLQTVLDFNLSFLHRETMVAIVACLEIIRRGIWNFFRLENEHLNNVGKYRAFKSVPLPFNYDEDSDKED